MKIWWVKWYLYFMKLHGVQVSPWNDFSYCGPTQARLTEEAEHRLDIIHTQ
jgi:hypothetical protein